MSKTQQVLSKTLILPAIGSFQYLAAVDPGLITANGTVLRPYIDTPDKDLAFNINDDGTIDIYNVSGRNLAAGKRIVVSATEKWFNAPVGGEQVVDVVAASPPLYPQASLLFMDATALDSQTFSNISTNILFRSSSVLPMVTRGYIDEPGGQGGGFVVRKQGIYRFDGNIIFSATAGGAGTVSVELRANSTILYNTWVRSVNFTSGVTDRALPVSFTATVTQAMLDGNAGTRLFEWKIFTSAGTITAKMGGGAATTTYSSSMSVLYLGPDYFTAA